jgi:hypothetical protein
MMTLLGVGVWYVRILMDDGEFNGETMPTRWGMWRLNRPVKTMKLSVGDGQVTCRASFLVAIAGPVAGAMFAGEWPPKGSEACRRIFAHDDGDWQVIDAGVTGFGLADEVKDQIVWAACMSVHEALRRNWRAADALARLLNRKGQLHYCEVRRVLGSRCKVL